MPATRRPGWRVSGTKAAPRAVPHVTAPHVQGLLLEARRAHPTEGPKNILPYLARRHPGLGLPAASTVGDLLTRHGLTEPRPRLDERDYKISG